MDHYSTKVDKDWRCGLRKPTEAASLRRGLESRVQEESSMRRTAARRHNREITGAKGTVRLLLHRMKCMQSAQHIHCTRYRGGAATPASPPPHTQDDTPPPRVDVHIPSTHTPKPPPPPEQTLPLPAAGTPEDAFRRLYEKSLDTEAALRAEVSDLQGVVVLLKGRIDTLDASVAAERAKAEEAVAGAAAAGAEGEELRSELRRLNAALVEAMKERRADVLRHSEEVDHLRSCITAVRVGQSPASPQHRATCSPSSPEDIPDIRRRGRGASYTPMPPGRHTPLSRKVFRFRGAATPPPTLGPRKRVSRNAASLYGRRRAPRTPSPPPGMYVNSIDSGRNTPNPWSRPETPNNP